MAVAIKWPAARWSHHLPPGAAVRGAARRCVHGARGRRRGLASPGERALFECLTGTRPYSARSAYEWITLHMEASPPELTQYGVPAPLARAVRRMLMRQPELRPQTMREVIQDLRTATRGMRQVTAFQGEQTHISNQGPTAIRETAAALEAAPPNQPPQAASAPAYVPPSQPAYAPPPQSQAYPQQGGYPQPGTYPGAGPSYAPAQYPPGYGPPQSPLRQLWSEHWKEILLSTVTMVIYLGFYWRETLEFFKRWFASLKPTL